MGDIDTLVEMGFEKSKAEMALNKTGNMGVEAAMEWLISNPDETEMTEKSPTSEEKEKKMETEEKPTQEAKSIKCDDCGKLLKGVEEAEYHSVKTGHSNFSESTEEMVPLTEEQKQEQLLKLQEIRKQRRKEREEKEKEENLEKEKNRRNIGKEMAIAKQKMEELEMKKMIDERKREKEEEKKARQRVREQIEKDKQDREKKFGGSSSENLTTSNPAPPTPSSLPTQSSKPAPPKEYDETKIQVRLLNGDKLIETFKSSDSLDSVKNYVNENCPALLSTPFHFSTSFPRRDYKESDYLVSLKDLGLVPSAVLMVKKL